MASLKRIAVATRTLQSGWLRETVLGIREYAEEQRWALLIQSMPHSLPNAQPSFQNVDGFILNLTDAAYYESFVNRAAPKVSFSDCMKRSPLPRVTMDNAQAGRLAAQHFLERNIRNLVFFDVDPDAYFAEQRQAGFVRAFEGRDAQISSLPEAALLEDNGRAFRTWLARTSKPVGFLAYDDYMAQHLAQCCTEWGFEVPGQVLILGFNNDVFHCEIAQPSISSVIMPSRAIGYKTAEVLDTLMRGRRLSQDEFLIPSPGIVERTSTRTAAFGCPALDKALRFIRRDAAKSIAVKQVVEHTGVSKRSLDRLFKEHLGHGPGEELRRTHLALAKFYLTTTSRPISEVARLAGFSNQTHLGKVMQRYEKQTPLEYRRRHASVGT